MLYSTDTHTHACTNINVLKCSDAIYECLNTQHIAHTHSDNSMEIMTHRQYNALETPTTMPLIANQFFGAAHTYTFTYFSIMVFFFLLLTFIVFILS